jgi:hypothetical protein
LPSTPRLTASPLFSVSIISVHLHICFLFDLGVKIKDVQREIKRWIVVRQSKQRSLFVDRTGEEGFLS